MEKEQELLERQSPEEEAAPIEEAPPPEAAPVEETPAQKLAACILATTREAHVTPLKKLKLHLPEGVTPEEAEELLTKAGTPEAKLRKKPNKNKIRHPAPAVATARSRTIIKNVPTTPSRIEAPKIQRRFFRAWMTTPSLSRSE